MDFRKVNINELNDVSAMVWEVFAEFIAPEYSEQGIESFKGFIDAKRLENAIMAGQMFIIGCWEEDKLVGVIAMREYTHICMLYVKKSYQGKGIAKELFKRAMAYCIKENSDIKCITVNASPFAENIYKKIGFEKTGEKTTKDGIVYVPMKVEFFIRVAKLEEMDIALDLLKEAAKWLKLKGINYWQNWHNPTDTYRGWIKEGFDNSEFYFFYMQNKLVGMFRLLYSDERFWGKQKEQAGYIHSLTTSRDMVGVGLGHCLLENVTKMLTEQNIRILRLDCGSNYGRLCRYYEDEGFIHVGEIEIFEEELSLYEKRW